MSLFFDVPLLTLRKPMGNPGDVMWGTLAAIRNALVCVWWDKQRARWASLCGREGRGMWTFHISWEVLSGWKSANEVVRESGVRSEWMREWVKISAGNNLTFTFQCSRLDTTFLFLKLFRVWQWTACYFFQTVKVVRNKNRHVLRLSRLPNSAGWKNQYFRLVSISFCLCLFKWVKP